MTELEWLACTEPVEMLDLHRLPALAEALQAAGCVDDAVIGHCQVGGEHARGCWVNAAYFERQGASRR